MRSLALSYDGRAEPPRLEVGAPLEDLVAAALVDVTFLIPLAANEACWSGLKWMIELFTAWLSPLTVFAGYLAPIVGPFVAPEKLEPTVWIESLASLF